MLVEAIAVVVAKTLIRISIDALILIDSQTSKEKWETFTLSVPLGRAKQLI